MLLCQLFKTAGKWTNLIPRIQFTISVSVNTSQNVTGRPINRSAINLHTVTHKNDIFYLIYIDYRLGAPFDILRFVRSLLIFLKKFLSLTFGVTAYVSSTLCGVSHGAVRPSLELNETNIMRQQNKKFLNLNFRDI